MLLGCQTTNKQQHSHKLQRHRCQHRTPLSPLPETNNCSNMQLLPLLLSRSPPQCLLHSAFPYHHQHYHHHHRTTTTTTTTTTTITTTTTPNSRSTPGPGSPVCPPPSSNTRLVAERIHHDCHLSGGEFPERSVICDTNVRYSGLSDFHSVGLICLLVCLLICLLVGCLTSRQHATVAQGRICLGKLTCCHTEIKVADERFYLTQSQYTDTEPTSPCVDPITPAW